MKAFNAIPFLTANDDIYMLVPSKFSEEKEPWWEALTHAANKLRLRLDRCLAWYGRDGNYDYAILYGDKQDLDALNLLTRAYMENREPDLMARYTLLVQNQEVVQVVQKRIEKLFPGGLDSKWSTGLAVVLMEDAMRALADEARSLMPAYVGPDTRLPDRFYRIQAIYRNMPDWYAAKLSGNLFPTWYRPEPEEATHERA